MSTLLSFLYLWLSGVRPKKKKIESVEICPLFVLFYAVCTEMKNDLIITNIAFCTG